MVVRVVVVVQDSGITGKVVGGGGWSWWAVVAGKEAGRRMGGVEEYDLRTRRRRTPKDG